MHTPPLMSYAHTLTHFLTSTRILIKISHTLMQFHLHKHPLPYVYTHVCFVRSLFHLFDGRSRTLISSGLPWESWARTCAYNVDLCTQISELTTYVVLVLRRVPREPILHWPFIPGRFIVILNDHDMMSAK
jgi:hypothetical protein